MIGSGRSIGAVGGSLLWGATVMFGVLETPARNGSDRGAEGDRTTLGSLATVSGSAVDDLPDAHVPTSPEGDEPAPDPCEIDQVDAFFGWEDGVTTVGGFGGGGGALLVADNVDSETGEVFSGDRSLRLVRTGGGPTSIAFVGRIENLQDGDVVTVSAQIFDQYPNTAMAGNRARIWTQYAISGGAFTSTTTGSTGVPGFTTGAGWEESSHSFVFDSDGGQRDAVSVQIRLNGQPEDEIDREPIEFPAEFYVDDLVLEVCSPGGTEAVFIFPDTIEPPSTACDEIDDLLALLGEPTVSGAYGWEDGRGDTIGGFVAPSGNCSGTPFAGQNITTANIGTDEGPVNSGDRALRLTEQPHCGSTPEIYLAFIEGLEHGDVIHGRVFGFDEVLNSDPRIRIWAKYAQSGDPESHVASAGGNSDEPTTGVGWEEVCHTWFFNAGSPPRDALSVAVRVYSTPGFCEDLTCGTDYFVDDIEVLVWSSNPGVMITFPDGSVIGEPVEGCPADFHGSGAVDTSDLLTILGAWGTDNEQTDLNGDGQVDGTDLGILLASWGPCEAVAARPVSAEPEFVVTTEVLGGGEMAYYLFVELDDADDVVVNVYDGNFTFPAGFSLFDAEYTIGGFPPSFNISADPNFQDLFDGGFAGADVGWYNFDPDDAVGQAGQYAHNRVQLARFIGSERDLIEGTLSVTYVRENGQIVQGAGAFTTDLAGDACLGDLTGDGEVDVLDLLALLDGWGPCPSCPEDLTGDGLVNVFDLLALLDSWGACP